MKKRTVALIVVALLFTNAITFAVANSASLVLGDKDLISKENYNLLKQFDKLFAVKNIIDKEYVDPVDENKLVEGAVRGLASGMGDPYTVYWDP